MVKSLIGGGGGEGGRVAQEGNKMEIEILCKWNGNFQTSKGRPFVQRVQFIFQPVDPKILAKWKLTQAREDESSPAPGQNPFT